MKQRYMACQFQVTTLQQLVADSEAWSWARGSMIGELDRISKKAAFEAEKLGLTLFLLQPAKESKKALGDEMFAELQKRTNSMEPHVADVEKWIARVQNMHACTQ